MISSRQTNEHNSNQTNLVQSKEQVLESYEQESCMHHRTITGWYDVPDIRKQEKPLLDHG